MKSQYFTGSWHRNKSHWMQFFLLVPITYFLTDLNITTLPKNTTLTVSNSLSCIWLHASYLASSSTCEHDTSSNYFRTHVTNHIPISAQNWFINKRRSVWRAGLFSVQFEQPLVTDQKFVQLITSDPRLSSLVTVRLHQPSNGDSWISLHAWL